MIIREQFDRFVYSLYIDNVPLGHLPKYKRGMQSQARLAVKAANNQAGDPGRRRPVGGSATSGTAAARVRRRTAGKGATPLPRTTRTPSARRFRAEASVVTAARRAGERGCPRRSRPTGARSSNATSSKKKKKKKRTRWEEEEPSAAGAGEWENFDDPAAEKAVAAGELRCVAAAPGALSPAAATSAVRAEAATWTLFSARARPMRPTVLDELAVRSPPAGAASVPASVGSAMSWPSAAHADPFANRTGHVSGGSTPRRRRRRRVRKGGESRDGLVDLGE